MSEIIEDELRGTTLAYVDKLHKRIAALEAALREHHDAWRGTIGHLNKAAKRIEALEAALRDALSWFDAHSVGTKLGHFPQWEAAARKAFAPEQEK